ncbi:MAG: type IV pilus modification protein PilV [Xanthomonadales bacterium]|nr:type IV pilus modification protein PilV [Gammaproteobacteria bacterium]NNJ66318.1 type IV pilus modification protein PilV [Xanthomonadales bacterium]NNK33532.1 type IV pilus modification protein PilV [Xanthomonadales bacterium]
MRATRTKNGGFSLLEVLIATVLMAVGLIGVASLQLTSSVFTESGLHRSHASTLAQEIFERMHVNHREAKAGSYDIATLPTGTASCGGSGADCTPLQLKDHDLLAWSARVNALLPGADAWIVTGADDDENPVDIAITLVWSQNRGTSPANTETFNFKLMGFDQ